MGALFYDARMLRHDTRGLSEGAERLTRTLALLEAAGLPAGWSVAAPRAATAAQVERVHRPAVLERLARLCRRGGGLLDMAPTVVSPESEEAAFLAAGAAIAAAERALGGEPAFALLRPPGHHATPEQSMGFCLFNNVAVAAAAALARGAAGRVMLVDFDLHHGNGTQDTFAADPRVLFVSLHQYPIYPGTGRLAETGQGRGAGYTVNVPFPAGAGDAAYAAALDQIIAPLARRFAPDLLLCSCGYDAHWAEREVAGAGLRLSVQGIGHFVQGLRALAAEVCAGRIAGVLEGGYHLDALAWGVLNTLRALGGEPLLPDPLGPAPEAGTDGAAVIAAVRRLHGLG